MGVVFRTVLVALGVLGQGAAAETLSATELLQQFNLITSGAVSSTSEVEGRALIGGSLSGSGLNVNFNIGSGGTSLSDFDALVVRGDTDIGTIRVQNGGGATVAGSHTRGLIESHGSDIDIGGDNAGQLKTLNGGAISVGGTNTGTVDAQGRAVTLGTATLEAPGDAAGTLDAFSAYLRGFSPTATAARTSNKITFGAAPTDGLTIYDIDMADLKLGSIEALRQASETVVINVSGTTNGGWFSNFVGTDTAQFAPHAIWNFHEATDLAFGSAFAGQVLAPGAAVTVTSPIEGSLYAGSVLLQGEMHRQVFAGSLPPPPSLTAAAVPLPAGALLLLGGLGVLAAVRRRS